MTGETDGVVPSTAENPAGPHPTESDPQTPALSDVRDRARRVVNAFGIFGAVVAIGGALAFHSGSAIPVFLLIGVGIWIAPSVTYAVLMRKMEAPASPSEWSWPVIWTAAAVSALAVLLLYAANLRLDLKQPDVNAAVVLFDAAIVAGLAVVLLAFVALRDNWRIGSVLAAIPLACLMVWPAILIATDFGKDGHRAAAGLGIAFAFVLWTYGLILFAGVVWVAAVRSQRHAGAVLVTFTTSIAGGVAAAAAYMLATMPQQAAEAQRINNASPGDALVFLVAVLAVAAIARRSRFV